MSHLEGQTFYDLLTLAAMLPRTEDIHLPLDVSPYTRLRNGEQLLTHAVFFEPICYARYGSLIEDFVTVGLPSEASGVHSASLTSFMGISAHSDHPEGAWQFIRRFLLPTANVRLGGTLPVRIDLYEQLVEKDMEVSDTQITPDGEEIGLSGETFFIGDFQIPIRAVTEEDADSLRGIVESVTHITRLDEDTREIIMEELQPFLADSRTIEETIRIMHSRVQTFLNERN